MFVNDRIVESANAHCLTPTHETPSSVAGTKCLHLLAFSSRRNGFNLQRLSPHFCLQESIYQNLLHSFKS